MTRIFVTGSINTDFVITTSHMPKSGETLIGNGFFSAKGGKGANQAVAAARLGGKVAMRGCVGDDSFGLDALMSLKNEGIDISHVRVCKNTPTGTAVIIVENGDNRIIIDKGANNSLSIKDIDDFLDEAKEGDIYLTQLENPIEVIGYGLKKAKEKGLYVILNPAPTNKEIIPCLKYCDLITPNENESEFLGGKEKLLKEVKTVLVTLGGKGFEIATKDHAKNYPCIKVNPIDTTAAGDTLCGGVAARLAEGKTMEEAAKFGSCAASIACTKKGAQSSIPTLNEVLRVIEKSKTTIL